MADQKLALIDKKIEREKLHLSTYQAEAEKLQTPESPESQTARQNQRALLEQQLAEMNNLESVEEMVAQFGQTPEQMQQAIAALDQPKGAANAQLDKLKEQIDASEKRIAVLQFQRSAQVDVNQLISEGKPVSDWMMAPVSIVVDAAIGVKRFYGGDSAEVKYKWEKTPWGQLVANEGDGLFTDFRDNMTKLKNDKAQIKAKVDVLTKNLEQLSARLDRKDYRDADVHKAENLKEGENYIVIKERWEEQKLSLQAAIADGQAALDDTNVALRAAFLQRLIQSTGSREREKKFQEGKLKVVEEEIVGMQERITDLERDIASLDGLEKEVAESALNESNKALAKLEDAAREHQANVTRLTKELDELNAGFKGQLDKYSQFRPGERGFLSTISRYAKDTMVEVMTAGWIRQEYKTPQNYRLEMQLANHGYTWQEGLKEFANIPQGGEVAYFQAQVTSFLKFSDAHPELARTLVTDVAITLSMLQDKGPYEALLTGLRARAYTEAALGKLGRNVEVPPRLLKTTMLKSPNGKPWAI